VKTPTQRYGVDHAGISRELGGQLLKPVAKSDCCVVRRIERYGLQVVCKASPVVLVTDLEIDLQNPEPAEETPATVFACPRVLVTDLDECSGNHVEQMIESTSRRELPRRANQLDEFIGRRLAAGDNCEFGDLLRVLLPTRYGDGKTSLDERLGVALCVEIRSHERRN